MPRGYMKKLKMKVNYPSQFFVCLVSYENTGKETDLIPPDCWGAVGWLAVDAESEYQLREVIKVEFDYLELKLIEINEIEKVSSIEQVNAKDSWLAKNVEDWEYGKRWVVGTLHGYYGEGEA